MEQIAKHRGIPSWETAVAAACDVSSPSAASSWEEQAFARDAEASLLVWPPRSYSCTFCRREFRSAQALGGHMNVHRRDRARLRHQDDEVQLQEEPHEDSSTYKHQAPISNPSTTTPSYRSTTIEEEESKRHEVLISMAARGQKSIHHHDQDLDDESGRSKRRRVDQVAVPNFVRSTAAAVVAVAPHEVFDLDHSEVLTKIIASPTSSSPDPPVVHRPEVDQFIKKQQLVDLELRLGTNPKVA